MTMKLRLKFRKMRARQTSSRLLHRFLEKIKASIAAFHDPGVIKVEEVEKPKASIAAFHDPGVIKVEGDDYWFRAVNVAQRNPENSGHNIVWLVDVKFDTGCDRNLITLEWLETKGYDCSQIEHCPLRKIGICGQTARVIGTIKLDLVPSGQSPPEGRIFLHRTLYNVTLDVIEKSGGASSEALKLPHSILIGRELINQERLSLPPDWYLPVVNVNQGGVIPVTTGTQSENLSNAVKSQASTKLDMAKRKAEVLASRSKKSPNEVGKPS